MTTIIGIETDKEAFIVADSRTTDHKGYLYSHSEVKKISERGVFLVAGAGETQPCDIAQHIWNPPKPSKADYKDLYHFMISKVMPSLRQCLSENGFNFDEDKPAGNEPRFNFLIAVGGEIFDIDPECSVSKNESGVYAIGSGGPYALGALEVGADAYQAMEAAAKLTAYTAPPYISKTQPKHIK